MDRRLCIYGSVLLASLAGAHAAIQADGGARTEAGGYRTHTFTGNGTFEVTAGGAADVLVVAGGGGGGGGAIAGGGGAGGLIHTTAYVVVAGEYAVVVGDGGLGGYAYNLSGQAGLKGANSSFGTGLVALGGGGGAGWTGHSSTSGGSGGGGNSVTAASAGTPGQGYAGDIGSGTTSQRSGGGGGGASVKGSLGVAGAGGKGGNGRVVFGNYYGGGGGGGLEGAVLDADGGGGGGLGGGGAGSRGTIKAMDGDTNTGGGGGGAGYNAAGTGRLGGKGGSGIVIVRYPVPISNAGGATNITASSAWLNGTLYSTGTSATAVSVYWGPSDGGRNAGDWAHTNVWTAPQAPGNFTVQVTDLAADSTYYYCYAIANADGIDWAPGSVSFITGEITINVASNAQEATLTPGAFTVSRPATAIAAPLVVTYTQTGGTAASGVDFAPLSGSVTIPAGASSAEVAVRPLKHYLLREDTTLELTLTGGQAIIVADSADTLTITDEGLPAGPTNVWLRPGGAALASTAANWSLGYPPTNTSAVIYLGPYASAPDMTWDLTNRVAGWLQTPEYAGTVTFTVNASMRLDVGGDIDIQSGHMIFPGDPAAIGSGSPSVKHGVGYTIQAANITIGTNASMNADGQGFAIKQGPGKGDSYVGASHGGCGGINTLAYTQPLRYGNLAGPTALGSGGNDKAGGGAIKLIATGTITIDGRVSADALPGLNGGGAGGSLWIAGGTLRGKGRISANGGTSSNTQCQGGGGRLDISGAVNDFTGTLQANGSGGTGYRRGTTGSILLPQSAGSGPTLDRFVPVTSIAFGNAVTFGPAAIIPSGVTLTLDANEGDNVFAFDTLIVSNSGTVACLGNTLAINSAAGGTSGNRYGTGVAITVTNLAIHTGGALHADSAGFGAATGPGSSTVSTWGGSYGGRGGINSYTGAFPLKPCYGSEYAPTALGSGGNGNVGGGAVKVTVAGTATINGRLSASSTTTAMNTSLGSGGSVWITGGTLAGKGVIAANGGVGGNTPAGGGGGRLDISGVANNFSGSLQVLGGLPNTTFVGARGQAGSIVLPPSAGTGLTMDHFVLTNAITFGNSLTFTQPVVVTNGGTLTFEANPGETTHHFTTLTVANGCTVTCKGNWAATNAAAGGTASNPYGEGIVIVATHVTVQTGGSLNANGGGGFYEGGPGRKLVYAAAYGGKSGLGFNSTYGTLFNVTALGSGAKGCGGGALKLVVGGTLTVDGLVAADGALADWNGAAGSGGSLWVDCNLLQGAGTLSANGGRAANAEGGGGGRVYLVYDSLGAANPVSANKILAYGGYGNNELAKKGGAGTVLFRQRSSPASAGTLIVKNDTAANNAVTPLPPDVVTTPKELAGVTLRIRQHGRVSLLSDLKIGDLFLTDGAASPATLLLNGHTLTVDSYYHNDWGNASWVVYGGGKIVWKSGMLLMVR